MMRPRVGPEGLQVTTQNARLLEGNTSAVPMPSGKPELMSSVGHKTMIAYRNSEAARVLRKVVLGGVEGIFNIVQFTRISIDLLRTRILQYWRP